MNERKKNEKDFCGQCGLTVLFQDESCEQSPLLRDKAEDLSDYLVRVRAAVKGIFGPDSSEYDMIGGTRSSERKKAKKKDKEE